MKKNLTNHNFLNNFVQNYFQYTTEIFKIIQQPELLICEEHLFSISVCLPAASERMMYCC